MPLQIEAIRERQADLVTTYAGEDIALTYRIGEISPELLEGLSTEPVRVTLSKVLVIWDIESGGVPYVPLAEDDPRWVAAVREQRLAQGLAEQAIAEAPKVARGRRRVAAAVVEAAEVVSEREVGERQSDQLLLPVDAAAIRQAFVAAWEKKLMVLPQTLLDAVLQAILDDMVGGRRPSEDSGAG